MKLIVVVAVILCLYVMIGGALALLLNKACDGKKSSASDLIRFAMVWPKIFFRRW